MNILEERQRAAEMTARCSSVEFEWRAPAEKRWVARLWCNNIGEHVLGYGPDVWTAVQAAHALREIADGRGTSYDRNAF